MNVQLKLVQTHFLVSATESSQSVLIRVITVLGRVSKNIVPEKASSILGWSY